MAISDPTRQAGASITGLEPGELQAIDLQSRPTLNVPVVVTSGSRALVGGLGILSGFMFREASAASAAPPSTLDADVDASSGNVANAAAVATLPGVAGQTTFITSFEATASGSTGALAVLLTVAGILGGTKTYVFVFPAGAALAATPLTVEFPRPIPASGLNTPIVVTLPAGGAGNTNAAVTAHGFQRVTFGTGVAATAAIDLLDGLDAGGELIAPITLGPGQAIDIPCTPDGPVFTRGLFLSVLSGTIKGAVWVKI